MLLHDAHELARSLMRQFLPDGNWHFEFDDCKTRFGSCTRGWQRITLSRPLTLRNDRSQVEDVIRHEIAHALVPDCVHHGDEWKRMCAVTGARPERCYDGTEVKRVEGDWSATCPRCKRVYYRYRQPLQGRQYFCNAKSCKRSFGAWSMPLLLTYWHKNALFEPTTSEPRRAAVESVKVRIRREQEMERMKERIAELEKQLGRG
jgi:predicted SprT family Zn-dependent metalloprotease